MVSLPEVIPIKDRARGMITGAHIVSASTHFFYDTLNAIAFYRFDNSEFYDFLDKTMRQYPGYCEDIARDFDPNLMTEVNYILNPDNKLLIPENNRGISFYRARRNISIFYDGLDSMQKAYALQMGIDLTEKLGCDRFGNIGRLTSLESSRVLHLRCRC